MKTDAQIPGGIYLCQVNESVSCGACCGLYNLRNASFEFISDMLSRRTAGFSKIPREMDAILEFGEKETAILGDFPMPEFHHCPYVGFIGADKRRVGCLLHPEGEGNRGVDYRGLSYYGSMTCRTYFCPAHRRIPPEFLQILRKHATHWYEWGLLVTETDMLELFYRKVMDRAGASGLNPSISNNDGFGKQIKKLMSLKVLWPYRAKNRPFANYFFNDPLYAKPEVNYTHTGKTGSRYDSLLRELHSVFMSEKDLSDAENYLDTMFNGLYSISVQ